MFELRPLSPSAIPDALARAERYRLLNEPLEAESICRDILAVDAENRDALVTLLLALTDQFEHQFTAKQPQARAVLERLTRPYDRVYYAGILSERSAKASLRRGGPHSGYVAFDGLRRAMELYEQALELDPERADPVLRWNTCARIIEERADVVPQPEEPRQDMLE